LAFVTESEEAAETPAASEAQVEAHLHHRTHRTESQRLEAPTRIELVYGEKADEQPDVCEPAAADASELPAELQALVERITRRERERR
jgi:hypothetical protein